MGFYFWYNLFYKDTILTEVIFNVHVFFMNHKHAFSTSNYFILLLDISWSKFEPTKILELSFYSLQFQIQARVDMVMVKVSKNQWECVVDANMRTLECISKKLRSFSSLANFSQRVQLLTSAALLSKVTSSFSFNYHSLTITPWIPSELF